MSAIIAKEMTYDAGGVTQDFRLKAAKLGSGIFFIYLQINVFQLLIN